MRFFTEGGQFIGLGGGNVEYADSVECLTDGNGEFNIPLRHVNIYKFLHRWERKGQVIIFKPGYGAFPGHPDASIKGRSGYTIPENESVTVEIPRLGTREERKKNLRNIPNINAPSEKYRMLRKYESFETNYVYDKKQRIK